MGSIMARCLPVGTYTTNSVQICEYIAEHSSAQIILAENREYAAKYLNLLDNGKIKLIVTYADKDYKPQGYEGRVINYQQFIAEG